MSRETLSLGIVQRLASLWDLHRRPADFKTYFAQAYGRPITVVPTFDCLYIGECLEGDTQVGSLGGILSRLWKVDDHGISDQRKHPGFESDEREFYLRPMIRFFAAGDTIVIGERLGPRLVCRKAGRIKCHDNQMDIVDTRIMWTADTL